MEVNEPLGIAFPMTDTSRVAVNVNITLSKNLTYNTSYHVLIDDGAFKNTATPYTP